jgi:predicted phosphodiesterase/transposase-like protein
MIVFTELQIQIIYLKQQGKSFKEIGLELGCDSSYVGKVWRTYQQSAIDSKDENGEFMIEVAKLQKQKQKLQDTQRIERKIREKLRLENAISEYTKELIKTIDGLDLNFEIKTHKVKNDYIGVLQLSDLHLNELISIPDNKFDFEVAAKRLQKFVTESKRIFSAYGITNVVIAMTGDLINSDRRLDEMLNMSTNRSKATMLAVILLEQLINDLAYSFNIKIASVSGNESRVNKEYGSTELMMSYNYDFNIYEILKLIYRGKSIEFLDCDPSEQVLNINGKNFLLIHGNQLKGEQTQSVQKIIGKHSIHGVKIDYVIFGHLHETRIGEYYSRSSSLCGANSYSDYDLQLISRASQNIHIVGKHDINSIKIDLQNTDGYEGYEIIKNLEAYNAKSYDKIKRLRIPKI